MAHNSAGTSTLSGGSAPDLLLRKMTEIGIFHLLKILVNRYFRAELHVAGICICSARMLSMRDWSDRGTGTRCLETQSVDCVTAGLVEAPFD